MAKQQTYLERLMEETLRPVLGALQLFKQEVIETMNVPESPWQILNKSYDELTEQEVVALFDIYHVQDENKPCPMCVWVTRMELMKAHQDERDFGG